MNRRQFLKNTTLSLVGVLSGGYIEYQREKYSERNNTSISSRLSTTDLKNKTEKKYTLEDYISAVIEIESNGNSNAERYEPHLDDYSYGLGQLLTRTAKDLEKRHANLPRLGNTPEKIKASLCDPEINKEYIRALFKEELDFYNDYLLAVASYNAGHFSPRNARCQQQLNDLYGEKLALDGRLGYKSKEVISRFQKDQGLEADGRLGKESYNKLQDVWQEKNRNKPNPKGVIPINNYTPNHVKKFKKALEKLKGI